MRSSRSFCVRDRCDARVSRSAFAAAVRSCARSPSASQTMCVDAAYVSWRSATARAMADTPQHESSVYASACRGDQPASTFHWIAFAKWRALTSMRSGPPGEAYRLGSRKSSGACPSPR